jgi:hypothetical protein
MKTMSMRMSGWAATACMASLCAATAAAPARKPGPRPPQALEQANDLLAAIRQAGADETPLDPARVEKLFGVHTGPDCRDSLAGQARVRHCRYVPVGPARPGALRFGDYVASGIGPGPMRGGSVTWEVERKRLCLTQRDLERAFETVPTHARNPVFLDFFPGSRYVESRSYDFTLPAHGANALGYRSNYIAVFEMQGCVVRLTLVTQQA